VKAVTKNPERYVLKIGEERNESNAKPAPSPSSQAKVGGQTLCPVTGDKLGSMGTPISVSVKGRTIFVCCQGCIDEVKADPDKFLRKVDDDVAHKQTPASVGEGTRAE
jgi:hypothetical protein